MKLLFTRLAMLALLLCGADRVNAENVTFEVSSWDDVSKKVVIKTDTRGTEQTGIIIGKQ